MSHLPIFPRFSPVSLDIAPQIHAFTSRYHPYSDFNFTSLFSWDVSNECQVSLLNNNLVILYKEYLSPTRYLSFLGTNKIEDTVTQLLQFTKEINCSPSLQLVPEHVASLIANNPEYIVKEDIDNHDYVLSTAQYAKLDGKKFWRKRNTLKHFNETYGQGVTYGHLNLANPHTQPHILSLVDQWMQAGTEGALYAANEIMAIRRLIDDISQLNSLGNIKCFGVVFEDQLIAFCIYETLPNQWSIIHFIKTNLQYKGVSDFTMIQLLNILHKNGIKYVNNEQDLGILGLRKHKEIQQPIGYLKKYTITTAGK